mgnify:CR=1 FL=1
MYVAKIDDEEIYQKIRSGEVRHVSIGASFEDYVRLGPIFWPRGLEFQELSILVGEHPGDPYSQVSVFEKLGISVEKVEEKMRERRESFEGHLAIATIKLIGRLKTLEIPFEDIWLKLKMELNGLDHPNKPNQMETELFGMLTKQKVGRRLREVLGSKTMLKRVEGGVKRVHVLDPMKVLKIAKKIHVTDVTDVTDFQEYKEGLEFLKKGLE